MAKKEQGNPPDLEVVEQLDEFLDNVVRGDLRAIAIERLGENSTPAEIKEAVIAAARNLAAKWSDLETPAILNETESRLFETINNHLSEEKRARWNQLVAQRDDETLNEEERQELIALGEELEALNVERLEGVAELAKLRGMEFESVCKQLGISPI